MFSLYGLIGKSLSHSFSQTYFTEKFEKENIEAQYENFELKSIDEFQDLLLANPQLKGLNVTIPYKQSVLSFLSEMENTASEIGAVNCIKISNINGKIYTIGYNTDWIGFSGSIRPFLTNLHHTALVLGTGGASMAIIYALKKLGIEVKCVSRNAEKGFSYDSLNKNLISHFKFIVNTTPVGMFPEVNHSPLQNFDGIGEDHLVVDLIYNPEETMLLKKCKEKGATVLNGLDMLKLQAEKSWNVWEEN